MTSARFSSSVMGSDLPRSRAQYIRRRLAHSIVRLLGLNRGTPLATEITQAIAPVIEVPASGEMLLFRGGHGRLVWRTATYATEEPETVKWLDGLTPQDVLWDIGANVGMYTIYAAKLRKCRVVAFEPESQNYALLLDNIGLNRVHENCVAANIAVAALDGFGYLTVRYLTKGGAHNQFRMGSGTNSAVWVPSDGQTEADAPELRQAVYGLTLNSLGDVNFFPQPTHIKIDVDGLEGAIMESAAKLLTQSHLRSILIELNKRSSKDMAVPSLLESFGFRKVSERSNWESRQDRTLEAEYPATNMIFSR